MNKKLLICLFVVGIIFVIVGTYVVQRPGELEQRIEQRGEEFKALYEEKASQGYDLSEAVKSIEKAKEAYDKGDYEVALKFLDESIESMERAEEVPSIELPGNWTVDDYIENVLPTVCTEIFLSSADMYINKTTAERLRKNLESMQMRLKEQQGKIEDRETENLIGLVNREITKTTRDISKIKGEVTRQDMDTIISDLEKIREYLVEVLRKQQKDRMKDEWVFDVFINKYKPKEYRPMKFSVTANTASYWGPAWNPTEEIVEEIDLLSELPVDSIRFDLMFDVWQQNEDVVDVIVKEIRSGGKDVWINFCGGETWRENPYSWYDFKKVYLENLERAVRKYQPEYVGVANEGPDFLATMVKEEVPEEEWVSFAEECTEVVKSIKPDCFVLVNTIPHPEGDKFFELLMNRDNRIDAIGIDPYSLTELEERGGYALAHWSNKDKELWITETWCTWDGSYPSHLCDKYIVASVYYAQTKGFNGYNLFDAHNLHTQNFRIIRGSNKTPAFYVYKKLIEGKPFLLKER